MLPTGSRRYSGRIESIFNALGRVVPSHLMDRKLVDFAALAANGVPVEDGDVGFDVDAPLETAVESALAGHAAAGVIPLARA